MFVLKLVCEWRESPSRSHEVSNCSCSIVLRVLRASHIIDTFEVEMLGVSCARDFCLRFPSFRIFLYLNPIMQPVLELSSEQ